MKKFFGLAFAAFCLFDFASQSQVNTQWKVKEDELMLLEKEGNSPVLFDKCPNNYKKCDKCRPFSDYSVNETFEMILFKKNKNKFYCFFEATQPEDKKKIRYAEKYSKDYKPKRDLLFTDKDICNAYCINAVQKKCGKITKDKLKVYGIKINVDTQYYCPIKKD